MQYYKILKEYNLSDYFREVLLHNKANALPYHNIYHLLYVMESAYKIAKHEKISDKYVRPLLIACLFHDFNHSGGALTDDLNVNMAIEAVHQYVPQYEDIKTIERLIKATQYPYIKDIEIDNLVRIIRSADLSQSFSPNSIQIQFGLIKEMGITNINEFFKKQKEFIDNSIVGDNPYFAEQIKEFNENADYLASITNKISVFKENEFKYLLKDINFIHDYDYTATTIEQWFINENERYRKVSYNKFIHINKVGEHTVVEEVYDVDISKFNLYQKKMRYQFVVDKLLYYVDVIPHNGKNLFILEIEFKESDLNVKDFIPNNILTDIIIEVTNIKDFNNYNLTKNEINK